MRTSSSCSSARIGRVGDRMSLYGVRSDLIAICSTPNFLAASVKFHALMMTPMLPVIDVRRARMRSAATAT